MSLDLTRPHKRVELTLNISANRQSVINGGEEFFTMDSGGTAVGIFNFKIEDENGEFVTLDLTGVKKILIGFYFAVAESRMVLEPEILDAENGRAALVLPNQFEYSGPAQGYTYILWDDRELDGGEFRLTFAESWLNKELPEMEEFYVQRFEDLAAEIRRRVEDIKSEMDSELKGVKGDIATAQADIGRIASHINENDIVTQKELLDHTADTIDALRPTTAPSPLAPAPQIGTSKQFSNADHAHEMPTASQVGALPLSGGVMTGDLTTQKLTTRNRNGENEAHIDIGLGANLFTRFFSRIENERVHFGVFDVNRGRTWVRYRGDLGAEGRVALEGVDVTMNRTLAVTGNITAPRLIGNADTTTRLQTSRPFAIAGAIEGTATSDLANGVTINTQGRRVRINDWDNINPSTLNLRNGDVVNVHGDGAALNQPLDTAGRAWSGTLKCITASANRFIMTVSTDIDRQLERQYQGTTWGSWQDVNETALRLRTPRQINGTNFNGSANITTANWGASRNITIGNATRSVNGSGNVSWSLEDIGAASKSHTHPPIQLPYNTNADTVTDPGNYRILSADANLPVGGASWGILEVLHENVQRYTNENSTPAYRGGVWTRVRAGGVWEPWLRLNHQTHLALNFLGDEIKVDINDIAELMLDDMTSEKKKALAERTKLRHAKEAKEIELFRSRRK